MKDPPKSILHLHTQAEEYARKLFGVFSQPIVDFVANRIENAAGRADLVMVPSYHFSEVIQARYNLTKSPTVWASPVDISAADVSKARLLARTLELPEDSKVVYFIGRIEPEKNIEFLLRVFALLEGEKRIHLVLAGGGQIPKLRKKVPQRLQNRIHFLGHVPREVTLGLCKFFQIGITASTTETQGLGLLEQMAMGMPVMAPIGTCFDLPIIDSGGGDIFPLEPRLWAQNIVCAIDDYDWCKSMGRMGSEYIENNYSPVYQHRKLQRIYERLAMELLSTAS